jgi:hypothetical protein
MICYFMDKKLKTLRKLMQLMHPKTRLSNTSRTTAILLEIYLNPGGVVLPIGKRVNLSGAAVTQHLERLAKWGMITPEKAVMTRGDGSRSLTRRPVVTPLGAQVIERLVAVLETDDNQPL